MRWLRLRYWRLRYEASESLPRHLSHVWYWCCMCWARARNVALLWSGIFCAPFLSVSFSGTLALEVEEAFWGACDTLLCGLAMGCCIEHPRRRYESLHWSMRDVGRARARERRTSVW